MKRDKLVQFGILFMLLAGFSAVSLGMIDPQDELVAAVSAAKADNGALTYVFVLESAFDTRVLGFLKRGQVCSLTSEQAIALSSQYDVENREFDVDGDSVKVLYVEGNPLNKRFVEQAIGGELENGCTVVQGNKMIALVTPIFIS